MIDFVFKSYAQSVGKKVLELDLNGEAAKCTPFLLCYWCFLTQRDQKNFHHKKNQKINFFFIIEDVLQFIWKFFFSDLCRFLKTIRQSYQTLFLLVTIWTIFAYAFFTMAKPNSEKRNIHMLEKKKRVWCSFIVLYRFDSTTFVALKNIKCFNAKC